MNKVTSKSNAEAITRLLERINNGENPKTLRKQATKLMTGIQPVDIARAEQNLIESGIAENIAHNLSSAFMMMGMLEDYIQNIKTKLPYSHIIRKVIAEHDLTRCYVAELEDVAKEIEEMDVDSITDISSQFRKLSHIVQHLNAMIEHIEREEDVIFPLLKKHGWNALCRASQNEHIYLRLAVSDLVRIVTDFNVTKTEDFKTRLNSITKHFCPRLMEHLLHEENILYPIALELISDKKVWINMTRICDEIGYCGTHV